MGVPIEYTSQYDASTQGLLEKQGVGLIPFSYREIKKNAFSVGLALKEKIQDLLGIRVPESTLFGLWEETAKREIFQTTLGTHLKSETLRQQVRTPLKIETSMKPEKTSLWSPQEDNSYGKKEKLKSKKLVEQLFAEGKSLSKYPIKLIYLKTELPANVKIQAGVAVPKKNFKSAVKRNRLKRLLRESYRLNKQFVFNNSEGSFAFLFLYIGKQVITYKEMEKAMGEVLRKFVSTNAKKKKDEETSL